MQYVCDVNNFCVPGNRISMMLLLRRTLVLIGKYSSMIEEILLAAKMYKCQQTAKNFFKEKYNEKIKWYIEVLQAVMSKENINEMRAVLFVGKLESVKDNGLAIMMFTAAALEINEGAVLKQISSTS